MDNPLNPYQIKYLCAHVSHHTKKRTQKAYQLSIKPFNDILKYRIYDKIPNEQLVCPHLSIRKAGLSTHLLALYWFMKDAYVVALQARGKDAAYIDALFAPINTGTFIVCLVSILVCAVIGGLFGQKMIKKHFAKAGIV